MFLPKFCRAFLTLIVIFLFSSKEVESVHASPLEEKINPENVLSLSANLYFDQKLNHLDSSNSQIFKQYFEIASTLARSNSAPVFYYLGAEGAISSGQMKKFQVSEFAKKLPYGAHLVQAEHRFYGSSSPFNELPKENLQYLDPDQALIDFSEIQKHIQKTYNLTGPWIVLGASYGANLAVLYRSNFPELAAGAIAYSEVLLLMGSPKWNSKFNAESREISAGKNLPKDCFQKIRNSVNQLETRYLNKNLVDLKKLADVEDVGEVDFLAAVSDATLGAALFNDEGICNGIASDESNDDDATKYVRATVTYLKKSFGSNLRNYSFSIGGRIQNQNSPANKGFFGVRQFAYQHCRFLNQPFVAASQINRDFSIIPIQVDLLFQKQFCADEFGLGETFTGSLQIDLVVQKILTPSSSGIVFISGGKDQWLPGSINSIDEIYRPDLSPNNLYLILKNEYHGVTLYESSPNMSDEERIVRNKTYEFIRKLIER